MESLITPAILNIEEYTIKNENFREVVYTNKYSQLAVMSLLPNEEIGMEVHNVDQFIRIERGKGIAIINNETLDISDGTALSVPAGTYHNVINMTKDKMKLYTIYSPPNEEPGLIQEKKPK